MKAILGSLLCLVLFASECFAISGGPPYPGSTLSITGSYAGVLTPSGFGTNALGIFTAVVPQTGLASGAFIVFISGRGFAGTLQGVADPNKALLRAVLQAAPILTTSGDVTVVRANRHADGSLDANIRRLPNAAFSISSTLLIGTATITVTNFDQFESNTDFIVDGFLQSRSPTG